MSTEPGWHAPNGARAVAGRLASYSRADRARLGIDPSMLLSFERPAPAGLRGPQGSPMAASAMARARNAEPAGVIRLSTVLENCTEATSAAIDKRRLKNGYHRVRTDREAGVGPDHRQDSKGTRWMPWHQESKKGVNGCDKPR